MRHAKTKKDLVVEFRRDTILEAALKAFARSGYEGTSVDTIAAEAGIAKGTVYLYFESKAEIYLSTIMHELNKLYAETERRVQHLKTAREKIEEFIRVRLQYSETNKDFFRIYLSEFGSATSHPAAIRKDLRKMKRKLGDLLSKVIEDGIAAREIRPLPVHIAAFAVADAVKGLVEKRIMGWSEAKVEADIDALADFLWSALKRNRT